MLPKQNKQTNKGVLSSLQLLLLSRQILVEAHSVLQETLISRPNAHDEVSGNKMDHSLNVSFLPFNT